MAKRWQSRSRRSESGFGRRRMGGVMRLHSISDTVKNGNSKTWWKYFAVTLWAKDRVVEGGWGGGNIDVSAICQPLFWSVFIPRKDSVIAQCNKFQIKLFKGVNTFKILNKSFVKYYNSYLWNIFSYFSKYKFCNKWLSSKPPCIWVRTLLLMKVNESSDKYYAWFLLKN